MKQIQLLPKHKCFVTPNILDVVLVNLKKNTTITPLNLLKYSNFTKNYKLVLAHTKKKCKKPFCKVSTIFNLNFRHLNVAIRNNKRRFLFFRYKLISFFQIHHNIASSHHRLPRNINQSKWIQPRLINPPRRSIVIPENRSQHAKR